MDSPLDLPMEISLVVLAPLLLLMWTWLLVVVGFATFEGLRSLFKRYSLVEAQIVDYKYVAVRVNGYRTSWVSSCPVYRLRYQYLDAYYEIECLVRDEQQVVLNKQAGTLTLHVPVDRPAHARAEASPANHVFFLLLVAALLYSSWLIAPFLLFGELR